MTRKGRIQADFLSELYSMRRRKEKSASLPKKVSLHARSSTFRKKSNFFQKLQKPPAIFDLQAIYSTINRLLPIRNR
ncbi:MAG: hypothetical protein DWI57_11285 [Chloroflexi bacterium]|nr:MAG: hypothetical protein DWI57_11285 [Chloroflexota bacterium]